jgi:hypothetical protein
VSVPAGDKLVIDDFPVTVTIENTGDADAKAVYGNTRSIDGSPLYVSMLDWKEFMPGGAGGTIAAGKSAKLDLALRSP